MTASPEGPPAPARTSVVLPLIAATVAMAGFQAGAAVGKSVFPVVGPQGAVTLRLILGAAMLAAVLRPWRVWPSKASLRPLFLLSASVSVSTLCFFQAIAHLPLGVAISLQFLGPLGVAIAGSRRPRDLIWAALAAAGVWSLVGAGQDLGHVDLAALPWAFAAAAGWAGYIVFGRAASAAFGRATAPAAVALAAVLVTPFGVAHAGAALLDLRVLPAALVMALLSNALPFALEMYALPRLPARTFATYTSLEPAFAVLVGLVVLGERLSPVQIAGVGAVVAAAAGAAWTGAARRTAVPPEPDPG